MLAGIGKSLFALFALALLAVLLRPAPASSDSWGPPEPADFLSANGEFRLNIQPGKTDDFDGMPDPEKPAPPKTGGPNAVATLARKGADGAFATVWTGPLVNKVAPVDALVADDGAYIVTFDDWGSIGYSDNSVAIYDKAGKHHASLALKDFLTAEEIAQIPQTVSSLMWYSEPHTIDAKTGHLILKTAVREVTIDLHAGKPLPKGGN